MIMIILEKVRDHLLIYTVSDVLLIIRYFRRNLPNVIIETSFQIYYFDRGDLSFWGNSDHELDREKLFLQTSENFWDFKIAIKKIEKVIKMCACRAPDFLFSEVVSHHCQLINWWLFNYSFVFPRTRVSFCIAII